MASSGAHHGAHPRPTLPQRSAVPGHCRPWQVWRAPASPSARQPGLGHGSVRKGGHRPRRFVRTSSLPTGQPPPPQPTECPRRYSSFTAGAGGDSRSMARGTHARTRREGGQGHSHPARPHRPHRHRQHTAAATAAAAGTHARARMHVRGAGAGRQRRRPVPDSPTAEPAQPVAPATKMVDMSCPGAAQAPPGARGRQVRLAVWSPSAVWRGGLPPAPAPGARTATDGPRPQGRGP